MARFDRPGMTFYGFVIVTIALSCTVYELFDVEYPTLKSALEVTQDRTGAIQKLGCGFLFAFYIVTLAQCCISSARYIATYW